MHIKNYCFLLTLIFLFAQCATLKNTTSGTFKDKRDGQTYKWIRLKDGKKWMAQNLNYAMADSWCYDNEDSNCAKYGRLYTWNAAKKVCPEGWRLPSASEWWKMMDSYVSKVGYEALRAGGSSGFSAQYGGYRADNGKFYNSHSSYYWCDKKFESSIAKGFGFSKTISVYNSSKLDGRSCRCLQD